eukprot:GHVT01033114.1.p1 GENE.GHVT01033114.1~~GHVT01033114.1.p1  ORF type:complete len:336 (+),score=32.09 GHVT01033114.1:885-1892(+)
MAGQWWRRGLAVAGNRLPVGTPCLGFNFFVNSGTTLGGSRCSTVSNVSCGSAPSLCGLTCSPRTSLLSSWGEGGPAHRWRQRISPSWGRPLFSVAEAPYEHQESRLVAYTPQEYFAVVLNVPEYKQFLPWCKDSRLVGGAMPNLTHTSARTKPATQIRLYLPQNETQPPSVSLPHSSTSACSSDSSTATSLGPCAPSTVFAPAVDFKNDGEAQTTLGGHTSNHQSAFQAKLAVGFGRVYEEYTSNVSFTTPHVIEVRSVDSLVFDTLVTSWRFEEGGLDGTTLVYLSIRFKFSNFLHQQLGLYFFTRAAQAVMNSFDTRAAELYGPRRVMKESTS